MKVPPLHRDGNKCSLDGAILRRGGHPRATLSSKMRRGGSCVPARTSTQRRFHTKIHALYAGDERWMRPCRATRAGTQAPPLPNSVIFFHAIPHKPNNHLRAIHPNDINRLRTIHPNEAVGAVPACPPERSRSGVSIPKILALCAGDERRMRPCRATRAGTQAPPLPNSVIHPRTILPNDIIHPNETRKQSPPHNRGRKCIAHSRPLNSK